MIRLVSKLNFDPDLDFPMINDKNFNLHRTFYINILWRSVYMISTWQETKFKLQSDHLWKKQFWYKRRARRKQQIQVAKKSMAVWNRIQPQKVKKTPDPQHGGQGSRRIDRFQSIIHVRIHELFKIKSRRVQHVSPPHGRGSDPDPTW